MSSIATLSPPRLSAPATDDVSAWTERVTPTASQQDRFEAARRSPAPRAPVPQTATLVMPLLATMSELTLLRTAVDSLAGGGSAELQAALTQHVGVLLYGHVDRYLRAGCWRTRGYFPGVNIPVCYAVEFEGDKGHKRVTETLRVGTQQQAITWVRYGVSRIDVRAQTISLCHMTNASDFRKGQPPCEAIYEAFDAAFGDSPTGPFRAHPVFPYALNGFLELDSFSNAPLA